MKKSLFTYSSAGFSAQKTVDIEYGHGFAFTHDEAVGMAYKLFVETRGYVPASVDARLVRAVELEPYFIPAPPPE